jgi:hypothetical protein
VFHLFKIAGKIPIRTQFGIERGENAMAVATRSKKVVLEKKIEEFCEQSAKLLTSIHERCSHKENNKRTRKGKRGRKKKSENI